MEKDERILLNMCRMSGREMDFIEEAFREEWVVPLGPNVDGFEQDLMKFLESDRMMEPIVRPVALSAGTAALHLALLECGVGPGDEVMVQSFTFAASVNPIRYVGADPVFVDSEDESWNIDPELLDFAIEDRLKKTGRLPKAIVVVDLYGMPARLDRLEVISRKWEIPMIEDAAEGLGSRFMGRCCGTFGQFGILSFNGNKIITTSGGGALVCHSEEARRHALYLATQARQGYAYYQHEEIGYNYRLSNISAGIGRGQMTVLEDYIAHHRHRQAYYREQFKDLPGIELHENPSKDFDSNFWLPTITLAPGVEIKGREHAYDTMVSGTIGGAGGVVGKASASQTDCQPDADVEALRLRLAERKIESRPLWKPMHRQPVYAGTVAYDNGVAESLFRRGLCLPAGPWVTDEDADRVVAAIRDSIL